MNQYTVIAVNFWSTAGTIQAHVMCVRGQGFLAVQNVTSTHEIDEKLAQLRAALQKQ